MAFPADPGTLAFNRFGLGARFDTRADFRSQIAKDPRGYLLSELSQDRAQLKSQDLADTKTNLLDDIAEQQRKKALRDIATGMSYPGFSNPAMGNPALVGTGMEKPDMAQPQGMQPPGMQPQAPKQPAVQREIMLAEAQARLSKAYEDPTGFIERLVWFWSNHFAVSTAKGQPVTVSAGSYEREAIRPHVLGRFKDMLVAVEQHPTMLFYLDNRDSVGPASKAGQRNHKGLNENLAREILELHTLGVNGGYTQADVTNFAKIITGWSWVGPQSKVFEAATFIFNPEIHQPETPKVLDKDYTQQGIAQGEAVLSDLARNPATAKHIAFKLARHFVADDPPPALVDKLAKTFLDSDGDLKAMTVALITDDRAWENPCAKFRTPQEFIMAAARACALPPNQPGPLLKALNDLGQPLWKPSGPNGFGDRMQDWASSEGMKMRLGYATLMAKQTQVPGNPNDILRQILADGVSPETAQAVARAESKQQGLALLLMSPEFQRR